MTSNANEVKNVLGTKLEPCCFEPKTGFYRDGFLGLKAGDKWCLCILR